jgi:NitT/TauT family transport system ATP-binding protein
MLDVSGLTLSYGAEPVLEGADLRVEAGQFVSLVGPSGSGKSSLLRAIMGLQRPSAGTVTLGLDSRDLGILFQDDALLPWRSALDNVALGLRIRGKPRPPGTRPSCGSAGWGSPASDSAFPER